MEISKKVVCCEPDLHNYRTLQIRFRNLRSRVIIKNLALSDSIGDAVYHIHHAGSAVNTISPKWKQILEEDDMRRWDQPISFPEQTTVSCVTLDYLIQQYGTPQFIKIDVEGSEQFVLKGLSKKIPYISFECLLPDCKQELLQCMDYLYHLDHEVLFTVAYEEVLEFDHFINYEDAIKWVHSARSFCFEMIAKMST